jgi:predicted DCC family thiol-disulfide oxidoreductase YuxK
MNNTNGPVLLFDGVCNLCNASVQWVLLRDKQAVFRFAPLQSDIGRQLLTRHGLDPDDLNSVVLTDGDRIWLKSDVPLEIFRRLGGWWALLTVLWLIPSGFRNYIYEFVARNRYRWWGRREQCMMPRREWKDRFIM